MLVRDAMRLRQRAHDGAMHQDDGRIALEHGVVAFPEAAGGIAGRDGVGRRRSLALLINSSTRTISSEIGCSHENAESRMRSWSICAGVTAPCPFSYAARSRSIK